MSKFENFKFPGLDIFLEPKDFKYFPVSSFCIKHSSNLQKIFSDNLKKVFHL